MKRPLPPHVKIQSDKATKVFSGKRFDIYQWKQKQFDGSKAIYEVAKREDTVVIIPVTDKGEILFVKEQQPHWDSPVLALVAGMTHPKEDLKEAARREFEEETGLVFKHYHLVHIQEPFPGVEWFVYTFIAKDFVKKQEKKLDAGEKNEVLKYSFTSFLDLVRKRKLRFPARIFEEMIIQDKLPELKKLLKDPSKYSIPL